MSIKSDKWIRRMAQEHGMIEPFESSQVRDGVIVDASASASVKPASRNFRFIPALSIRKPSGSVRASAKSRRHLSQ